MIRLTNGQWERIRNHFLEERIPMDVLDASRSRPDVFSKLYCGYSTPARSGTCCRKLIRTTNPFIGAFKPGAAMKFGSTSLPSTPLGFPDRPESFSRRVAQGARGCSRRAAPLRAIDGAAKTERDPDATLNLCTHKSAFSKRGSLSAALPRIDAACQKPP